MESFFLLMYRTEKTKKKKGEAHFESFSGPTFPLLRLRQKFELCGGMLAGGIISAHHGQRWRFQPRFGVGIEEGIVVRWYACMLCIFLLEGEKTCFFPLAAVNLYVFFCSFLFFFCWYDALFAETFGFPFFLHTNECVHSTTMFGFFFCGFFYWSCLSLLWCITSGLNYADRLNRLSWRCLCPFTL